MIKTIISFKIINVRCKFTHFWVAALLTSETGIFLNQICCVLIIETGKLFVIIPLKWCIMFVQLKRKLMKFRMCFSLLKHLISSIWQLQKSISLPFLVFLVFFFLNWFFVKLISSAKYTAMFYDIKNINAYSSSPSYHKHKKYI